MTKKIIERSISLTSYLEKVKEEDISDNQDVQRMFCSDNSFINELVVSVLTEDYIPPIILGEEEHEDGTTQQYIADGMQRTSALVKFRYAHHKITPTIEDSIIKYQRKKKNDDNKTCKDNSGNVIWETVEFNIKGKTFEMLPDELKKIFDDYQIRIVVHQNCTMKQISKYVRRYNNHKGMNTSQRALTYIDEFARKIKNICQNDFFKNCISYSDTERKKGTYEKIVCESVMAVKFLEHWKKQPKHMDLFLNNNSCEADFDLINSYANRIAKICGDKFTDIFIYKDICVWFSVFDKFAKLGFDDSKFVEFIYSFKNNLHNKDVNGLTYDYLTKEKNTKDKKIITEKIDTLYALLLDFLHIDIEETDKEENIILEREEITDDKYLPVLDFVRENISSEIKEEDIDCFYDMIDDYKIDKKSRLLDWQNEPSLIAIIAYSFRQDIDLDDWIKDYFNRNVHYIKNQKENYLLMLHDLNEYIENNEKRRIKHE